MARIKNPLSSSLKKLAKFAQKEPVAYHSNFERVANNLEANSREDFVNSFFRNKFGKLSLERSMV